MTDAEFLDEEVDPYGVFGRGHNGQQEPCKEGHMLSDSLNVHKRNDGFYEVIVSKFVDEQGMSELEALIKAVTPMGLVVRTCKHRDRAGNLRPVKVLLTIDPSLLDI